MSNKVCLELNGDEKQIAKCLDALDAGESHGAIQFAGGLIGTRAIVRDNIIEFEADDFKVSKILYERSSQYPDIIFTIHYVSPSQLPHD